MVHTKTAERIVARTRTIRGGMGALAIAALMLTGCAAEGEKVASLDDDAPATSEPDARGQGGDGAKFAECMRDHGIDIEDPDVSEGAFAVTIPEGVDREEMEEAMQACKEFMPNGGEPPKLDPEAQAKMRAFAECMRRNGVEEFPDPGPGGGFEIDGDSGFDPMSEEAQAAQEKCRDEMPVLPGAPSAPGTSEDGPESAPSGGAPKESAGVTA
ncbi:hypothetical protein [Microbacterium sp.]|uniref:hypothetical protein n=1 Tax=Microbacterium sp. TaxID=51671 RepID=UPI002811CC0A|nr:hypothetical protein [Microbacterium sp.]